MNHSDRCKQVNRSNIFSYSYNYLHSFPKEVNIDFTKFSWWPWVTKLSTPSIIYLSPPGRLGKNSHLNVRNFWSRLYKAFLTIEKERSESLVTRVIESLKCCPKKRLYMPYKIMPLRDGIKCFGRFAILYLHKIHVAWPPPSPCYLVINFTKHQSSGTLPGRVVSGVLDTFVFSITFMLFDTKMQPCI